MPSSEANPFPPEVHIQFTKPEIDPFAVEIGPTDRVLMGAAGAVAMAGNVVAEGVQERFQVYSTGLKQAKNSLVERFRRHRQKGESAEEIQPTSLLDLEKEAVEAKASGDWMGYQKAVLGIADYIDREEAKSDSHKEAYGQMRIWIDKKLSGTLTPDEREQALAQKQAQHRQIYRATKQAAQAKASGDWMGYQKAALDLADTVEAGQLAGIKSPAETQALVDQIDSKLNNVASSSIAVPKETIGEVKKPASNEIAKNTAEWIDPSNILGLRELIEYQTSVRIGTSELSKQKQQDIKHQVTTEALARYFGVDATELEDPKKVPADVYHRVLQLLHLPAGKLDRLAEAHEIEQLVRQRQQLAAMQAGRAA